MPTKPRIDDRLMMDPGPRRGREGMARIASTPIRIPRKTPSRLMRITARQSSRLVSSSGLLGPIPALLTRTSSLPNSLTAASTAAFHSCSRLTSCLTAMAPRFPRRISFATSSAPSRSMSVATICAPSRASDNAAARPMPAADPVNRAILSATRAIASTHRKAAVDDKDGAVDIVGVFRGQEGDERRTFLWRAESKSRNHCAELGAHLGRLSWRKSLFERGHHSEGDRAGMDGVHADSSAAPLCSGASGQSDNRLLARVIGADASCPCDARDAGGIDHRAAAPDDRDDVLQTEEHSADIDVKHAAKVGQRVFGDRMDWPLDSGVAEENVDSAGRLAGAGDEGGDRPLIADVAFDSSQVESMSELGCELLQGLFVPIDRNDARPASDHHLTVAAPISPPAPVTSASFPSSRLLSSIRAASVSMSVHFWQTFSIERGPVVEAAVEIGDKGLGGDPRHGARPRNEIALDVAGLSERDDRNVAQRAMHGGREPQRARPLSAHRQRVVEFRKRQKGVILTADAIRGGKGLDVEVCAGRRSRPEILGQFRTDLDQPHAAAIEIAVDGLPVPAQVAGRSLLRLAEEIAAEHDRVVGGHVHGEHVGRFDCLMTRHQIDRPARIVADAVRAPASNHSRDQGFTRGFKTRRQNRGHKFGRREEIDGEHLRADEARVARHLFNTRDLFGRFNESHGGLLPRSLESATRNSFGADRAVELTILSYKNVRRNRYQSQKVASTRAR